jgi:hypothetical protein
VTEEKVTVIPFPNETATLFPAGVFPATVRVVFPLIDPAEADIVATPGRPAEITPFALTEAVSELVLVQIKERAWTPNPDTVTGMDEFVVVPFPSSPETLYPQHCAVPFDSVAQALNPPCVSGASEIEVTPVSGPV